MTASFAKADAAGEEDVRQRIPELRPLANLEIALAGLGGLGSVAAVELAKAGAGGLSVLDGDRCDPAAGVRWPVGAPAAGLQKTAAVRDLITANWPLTHVRATDLRLGQVRAAAGDGTDQAAQVELFFGDASLVLDATAEPGVQYFLSVQARRRGMKYVFVEGTQGGWGGLVGLITAEDDSPCWLCFQRHWDAEALPVPPEHPTGSVQPVGCADPTFTGAGFDLVFIASLAVRLVVGTLCGGEDGGYPAPAWNLAIISLRGSDGAFACEVESVEVGRDPDCPGPH